MEREAATAPRERSLKEHREYPSYLKTAETDFDYEFLQGDHATLEDAPGGGLLDIPSPIPAESDLRTWNTGFWCMSS